MSGRVTLKIRRGSTFRKSFRWEAEPYIYKPITGISNSAPCRITCIGHGLLDGQPFLIQSAKGLTELNETLPINKSEDWRRATVIDPDTIELNRVNSTDFKAYTSSGNIKYRTIKDLTGHTASILFLDRVGGDVLYTISDVIGNLIVDDVGQWVHLILPDEDTLAFDWKKGVYDLDLSDALGEVTTTVHGPVYILNEGSPE